MTQKITATFIAILVSSILFAQGDIRVVPKDSWIDEVEIPLESQVSKYEVQSGAYHKLIDYQVNLNESAYYSHFVYNVLTSGGASNVSQLEISYDSSYQKVKFHQLTIHRNGSQLDRTGDVTFEYIKNEQMLQSNIYTGDVTALVVLEDVRKGDWIEFSYTIEGQNPVFSDDRYYITILDDINPIDRIFIKVNYPSNESYGYYVSPDIAVDKTDEKGITSLRIDRRDVDAVEVEETTPSWIIPFKYFEISNRSSWAEVNEWALSLFDKKENDAIDQVFEEIFYPEFTDEDKINAIIDFVQDEIRYMGIEAGMGSIVPFSPNQVIKQRFGDCKDKSLLMSAMMQKLGIACYPALVNSLFMERLEDHQPSGHMFDHVIVTYRYKGQDYWIDPTYPYQGGDYKDVITYDYGKALVVKEGTTKLTEMNVEDKHSSTIIEEYIDASSYDAPANMKVITNLTGSRADYTRQILEYYSIKQLADYYKSFYSRMFPSLYEDDKMKVNDDMETNRMVTTESYLVPDIWKEDQEGFEGKYTLDYQPMNVYAYLSSLSCEKKEFPVQFAYPVKFSQKTTIEMAESLNLNLEDKTYDNVAFTFSKKLEMDGPTTVKIEYEYETKVKEIKPEDFPKVCQDINEIVDNIPITFYFPKNRPTLESLPFDFDFYEVNLLDEKISNQGYYIESIRSKITSVNNVIGILEIQDKEVTAGILKDGIAAQLQKFLDANQTKGSGYVPLTLTIAQLKISEEDKKKMQKAMLEFDYRVSYVRDGKKYEYRLIDNLESEAPDVRALHEKNIRRSLEQLLSELSPAVFKEVD